MFLFGPTKTELVAIMIETHQYRSVNQIELNENFKKKNNKTIAFRQFEKKSPTDSTEVISKKNQKKIEL